MRIDVTVSDDCFATNSTCGSTYTVPDAPPLVCKAPDPKTTTQCEAGDFATWLGGFAGSGGGCDPDVRYAVSIDGQPAVTMTSLTGVVGPDECGGSVRIDVTVSDDCFATNSTCGSTYMVPVAKVGFCEGPDKETVQGEPCWDQNLELYQAWRSSFKYIPGDCSTVQFYVDGFKVEEEVFYKAPMPDDCVGTRTLSICVTDPCSDIYPQPKICKGEFVIPNARLGYCENPGDLKVEPCADDNLTRFQEWRNSFKYRQGDCSTVQFYVDGFEVEEEDFYNAPMPDECGESRKLAIEVNDPCADPDSNPKVCVAKFVIPQSRLAICTSPGDLTGKECGDRNEFEEWRSAFRYIPGDCSYPKYYIDDKEVSASQFSQAPTPNICGGTRTLQITVVDPCNKEVPFRICKGTYTTPPPPPVYLGCPSDKKIEACLNQTEVDNAFKDWVKDVKWEGGCNSRLKVENAEAPDFCGGSTTVTWRVISDCETRTCSATFSVDDASPVDLQVPANKVIAACTSPEEIEEEYIKWLRAPTFSGGCKPYIMHNSTGAPDACGGSKTVTWMLLSNCEVGVEKSSTFTVLPALTPVLKCPSNMTMPSCSTESEVSAAFASWISTVSLTGACPGVQLSNDNTGPPSACGGSTTVTWSTDGCVTETCSATFTVAEKTPVTGITIPEDITLMPCMTSDYKIDEMYNEWLESPTFTGGCGAVLMHNGTGPPSTCGGSSVVTWKAVDDCGETVLGTATFRIDPSPDVDLVCPGDYTTAKGLTEAEIASEFEEWVGSATFVDCCNATLQNTSSTPPKVCGGTVTVTWLVESDCRPDAICYATFTVPNEVEVSISCPPSVKLEAGVTQQEVDNLFNNWIASATTDHSEPLSNNSEGPPSADGGIAVVTWTTNTGCGEETCTSTFEVEAPKHAYLGVHCYNEIGESVENVKIDIAGDMSYTNVTDNAGNVQFNVPMHGNYDVTGKKSEDLLNGVTTYDIVAMVRHLLGITELNSPYKMIAADVNNSGTISTGDIITLRKAILTLSDNFTNNDSWIFVDANYVFPDPTNPWSEKLPQKISITDVEQDINTNFIGIKIGDLNGSSTPNELLGSASPVASNMVIGLEERQLVAGQQYSIEFKARDFNHFGYQFTIGFDRSAISVDDVQEGTLEGLSLNNFGLQMLDQGAITTSWDNPNVVKLEDDETLFRLNITANANKRLSSVLNLNSTMTIAEAVNVDLEPTGVTLEFFNRVEASFELFQNIPNPFSDHTFIQFNLPKTDQVQLKIYDVAGKVLYTQSATFDKGTHQIRINKSDLSATGVLYYQVETSTDVATKKMILLE
ncbi:MAG: T9SS type A sorting domain-containing protein [Bacteroidia bacterium]|nr:T9SS type A sorting domain-containing protein [Bacteroidia bacterium]